MVFEIFVNASFVGYADGESVSAIEDALIKRFGADAVDVYEFYPTEGWLRLEDVDDITP